MNDLEKMLAEQLSATDDLTAPRVDVAGLARAGRAERRRRTGIGVAVAAAVAVVATTTATTLVTGGSDPRSDERGPAAVPATLAEVPVGAPSNAPWFDGKVLHAGGTTYRVQASFLDPLYSAGVTLTAVRVGTRIVQVMVRGGEVTELASEAGPDSESRALLSADGTLVALMVPGEGRSSTISLVDTADGTVVGEVDVDQPVSSLSNVTADGRVVYLVDGAGAFVWTPGAEPVPVRGLSGGFTPGVGSYPGGFAIDGDTGSAYGTIDGSGRFVETGELVQENGVAWGPTGDLWAYVDPDRDMALYVDGTAQEPSVLRLPSDVTADRVVGWESASDLVVDVTVADGKTARLRCEVADRVCEQVPLRD